MSQFQKSVVVIPAKAGIQRHEVLSSIFNSFLDTGLRRCDGFSWF